MTILDELKKLEDEAVETELWLFTHKKDVDARRLLMYGLLKKIADVREREKEEMQSRPRDRSRAPYTK